MTKNGLAVLAVVGAILFLASSTEAIKCYECTGCDKPTGLKDCGDGNVCMKTEASVEGRPVVGRQCVPRAMGENGCKEVSVLSVKTIQCFCDKDECNAALPSFAVSMKCIIITLLFTILFTF